MEGFRGRQPTVGHLLIGKGITWEVHTISLSLTILVFRLATP